MRRLRLKSSPRWGPLPLLSRQLNPLLLHSLRFRLITRLLNTRVGLLRHSASCCSGVTPAPALAPAPPSASMNATLLLPGALHPPLPPAAPQGAQARLGRLSAPVLAEHTLLLCRPLRGRPCGRRCRPWELLCCYMRVGHDRCAEAARAARFLRTPTIAAHGMAGHGAFSCGALPASLIADSAWPLRLCRMRPCAHCRAARTGRCGRSRVCVECVLH